MRLAGEQVYFDANIVIYILEDYPEFQLAIRRLRDAIKAAEFNTFTSEMTLAEVLVGPFKKNDAEMANSYREFLEDSGAFVLLATTREVYVRSAIYRASFGLKTPDAIHVASAVEAQCGYFLTHDKAIRLPSSLRSVTLNEI